MCTAICSVNASPTTMALWARRLGVRFRCEQRPCWLGDQCCLQHVGKISRGLKIRLHVVIVLKVHYAVLVDLPLTHQGACCIVQSTTLDCHAISYVRPPSYNTAISVDYSTYSTHTVASNLAQRAVGLQYGLPYSKLTRAASTIHYIVYCSIVTSHTVRYYSTVYSTRLYCVRCAYAVHSASYCT